MRRVWVIGGSRREFERWRFENSNRFDQVNHISTPEQLHGIEIRPDDGDVMVELGGLDWVNAEILKTRIRPGKR